MYGEPVKLGGINKNVSGVSEEVYDDVGEKFAEFLRRFGGNGARAMISSSVRW